jgi:hypothetical protein
LRFYFPNKFHYYDETTLESKLGAGGFYLRLRDHLPIYFNLKIRCGSLFRFNLIYLLSPVKKTWTLFIVIKATMLSIGVWDVAEFIIKLCGARQFSRALNAG